MKGFKRQFLLKLNFLLINLKAVASSMHFYYFSTSCYLREPILSKWLGNATNSDTQMHRKIVSTSLIKDKRNRFNSSVVNNWHFKLFYEDSSFKNMNAPFTLESFFQKSLSKSAFKKLSCLNSPLSKAYHFRKSLSQILMFFLRM